MPTKEEMLAEIDSAVAAAVEAEGQEVLAAFAELERKFNEKETISREDLDAAKTRIQNSIRNVHKPAQTANPVPPIA